MPETNSKNSLGVNRPIQIIPSVLPADWANMGACVKDLEEAGVDRIQFDVMDGNFVPNLTFGPEMIAACRKYCEVPFETQLMVSQYNCETMLEAYVKATKGPNGEPGVVIAHAEANVHLHRVLGKIRDLGGSPSVALNPHTPFEMIENIMDMVDHVLVMTGESDSKRIRDGTAQPCVPHGDLMVDRDVEFAICADAHVHDRRERKDV